MITNPVELDIHRFSTQAFIDANPTVITLTPITQTTVAGTATYVNGADRNAQTFKVIWTYDNGVYRQVGAETTDPGGARRFDFILVGAYDAEVAIGDFWQVGSQQFKIEYIFPSNGYEVKAGGVSHGPFPG